MKHAKNIEEHKEFERQGILFTGLFILFIIITIVQLFSNFQVHLKSSIQKQNEVFLMETANQSSKMIQMVIEQKFQQLEIISHFCETNSNGKDDEIMELLKRENQRNPYQKFGLMDLNGNFYRGDGKPVDYRNNAVFMNAFEKEHYISEAFLYEATGKTSILISVPILRDGKIDGLACTIYDTEYFTDMFSRSIYDDTGATLVIQENGAVISGYEGFDKFQDFYDMLYNSGFEYEEQSVESLIESIKKKESGIFIYSKNQNNRYLIYTPTGIKDWVTISLVIAHAVEEQSKYITGEVYRLSIIQVLIFLLLSIVVFFLYKNNERFYKEKEMNKRFQIVARQTKSVIYDYDVHRKSFYFSKGIETVFSGADQKLFKEQIHKEDRYKIDEAKKKVLQKQDFKDFDIRVQNKEGDFIWYRISGEIIFSQRGFVKKVVGKIENVHKQKLEYHELQKLSNEDRLTNVYNKSGMEKTVRTILEADQHDSGYAFYFIDIDNFKQFNDCYGHDVGDEVIITTSKCIKETFKEWGIVGRFGGDEFVVLAKKVSSLDEVEGYSKRLLTNIKKQTQYSIGLSIGIAVYPDHGKTYEELMKNADLALYQAKKRGKNQYAVYDGRECDD